MPLFIDGKMPTEQDEMRLKLLLSTYTDGSGENEGGVVPGGFNFERAATEWMDGIHIPGTKHIYDVVVHEGGKIYGYSCKMRGTLKEAYRKEPLSFAVVDAVEAAEEAQAAAIDGEAAEVAPSGEAEDAAAEALEGELTGYCLIEVSNAGAEFLGMATDMGVTKDNIAEDTPEKREALRAIGEAIVSKIESWHHDAQPLGTKKKPRTSKKSAPALHESEELDPAYENGSLMLHLAWSKPKKARKATKKRAEEPAVPAEYQLFVFDRHIATKDELAEITWKGRKTRRKFKGRYKETSTLYGTRPTRDGKGQELAIEIYLFSGGHVKYFPRASEAIWVSKKFSLLEAPRAANILSAKAQALFPDEWALTGIDKAAAEAIAGTVEV